MIFLVNEIMERVVGLVEFWKMWAIIPLIINGRFRFYALRRRCAALTIADWIRFLHAITHDKGLPSDSLLIVFIF